VLNSRGLYGYIQNNNLRSVGLLFGFLIAVQMMMAAVYCWIALYVQGADNFGLFLQTGADYMASGFLPVIATSLVWVTLAFTQFTRIMRDSTGLHFTSRSTEPRLYNIVENLSISVGLPTPKIEISESPALNAFAMGLSPNSSTIGVTRGLLNGLNDEELETVIAHELTHIRAHDVRLLTLATILCGIIFSAGWFFTYRMREMWRMAKAKPIQFIFPGFLLIICGVTLLGSYRGYALMISAIFVFMSLLCGLGLRMAISQTREFVADAGALELTKNPEALISALLKIEGRSLIDNGDVMLRSMMISAPSSGLSATHPKIEIRIDAIVEYAAQNLKGLKLAPAAARFIPRNDDQEFKAGFSISHMKYPAWISKPIIVMPSLATGGILFLLSHYGLTWMLSMLSQTPDVVLSVYNVDIHANGNDLRGTFSSTDQGHSFWEEFGPRDIKIMLLEMLPGIPLIIGARYLIKSGIGKDNKLIRQLAGLPSKEMASDWDDDTNPQQMKINIADRFVSSQDQINGLTGRLNEAMNQSIAEHQAARRDQIQSTAPTIADGRPIFGKAPIKP
jgi:heat shock protein HtpX